jgi:hypothetical protein
MRDATLEEPAMPAGPPPGRGAGTDTSPPGFSRLRRSGAQPGAQVGCLFILAGVLLVIGIGLLAAFAVNPAGEGDMWVMPVVGGAFALIGGALLYAGLRGARGLKIPWTEVYLERGAVLEPGASARVRIRQPGPITIESLKLKVLCERVYQRQVKRDSTSTVEDQDVLWEQNLLQVRNEQVPRGAALEREATLSLPPDARATGPALPDGRIRWKLEVWGETGVLSAIYHPFDIAVGPREDPAALAAVPGAESPQPASAEADAKPAPPPRPASKEAEFLDRFGCLFLGAGFLFGGVVFIWMFFSGAAFSGKGNPYMALIGGALFAGIGILALTVWALSVVSAVRTRHRKL